MRSVRLLMASLVFSLLPLLVPTGPSTAHPGYGMAFASRRSAGSSAAVPRSARAIVSGLKEINYYPSSGGWTYMWTRFHAKVIDQDFARIHRLGANTVRIVLQPEAFGYPTARPVMGRRLAKVIAMAAKHSLRVHLTLFDLWDHPADVMASRHWVRSLLSRYRSDRRIVLVELHNEVRPNDSAGMAWVRAMLPYLSKVLPGTLRTVSTADILPSAFASFVHELKRTPPDVWDYHYYSRAADARLRFAQIKELANPRPLFIGETGTSSYGLSGYQSALEQRQANYVHDVFAAAAADGLPYPAPWILYDFSSGAIPPGRTAADPRSYHYGLFRLDGTRKPVASIVAAAFTDRAQAH